MTSWIRPNVTTKDPTWLSLELEDLQSPSVNVNIFLEKVVYWINEEIRNGMLSPSELSFRDWNGFVSFHIFNNKVFVLFPNTIMWLINFAANNFHAEENGVRQRGLGNPSWMMEEGGERGGTRFFILRVCIHCFSLLSRSYFGCTIYWAFSLVFKAESVEVFSSESSQNLLRFSRPNQGNYSCYWFVIVLIWILGASRISLDFCIWHCINRKNLSFSEVQIFFGISPFHIYSFKELCI